MALNEETAAASTLAPDTGRPLTTQEKWRFGIGFALFSLIWMTAGTSGSQVLLPQRFTELGIGVPEVILGTMNSVGCVFALIANIVFGAMSDITRPVSANAPHGSCAVALSPQPVICSPPIAPRSPAS